MLLLLQTAIKLMNSWVTYSPLVTLACTCIWSCVWLALTRSRKSSNVLSLTPQSLINVLYVAIVAELLLSTSHWDVTAADWLQGCWAASGSALHAATSAALVWDTRGTCWAVFVINLSMVWICGSWLIDGYWMIIFDCTVVVLRTCLAKPSIVIYVLYLPSKTHPIALLGSYTGKSACCSIDVQHHSDITEPSQWVALWSIFACCCHHSCFIWQQATTLLMRKHAHLLRRCRQTLPWHHCSLYVSDMQHVSVCSEISRQRHWVWGSTCTCWDTELWQRWTWVVSAGWFIVIWCAYARYIQSMWLGPMELRVLAEALATNTGVTSLDLHGALRFQAWCCCIQTEYDWLPF